MRSFKKIFLILILMFTIFGCSEKEVVIAPGETVKLVGKIEGNFEVEIQILSYVDKKGFSDYNLKRQLEDQNYSGLVELKFDLKEYTESEMSLKKVEISVIDENGKEYKKINTTGKYDYVNFPKLTNLKNKTVTTGWIFIPGDIPNPQKLVIQIGNKSAVFELPTAETDLFKSDGEFVVGVPMEIDNFIVKCIDIDTVEFVNARNNRNYIPNTTGKKNIVLYFEYENNTGFSFGTDWISAFTTSAGNLYPVTSWYEDNSSGLRSGLPTTTKGNYVLVIDLPSPIKGVVPLEISIMNQNYWMEYEVDTLVSNKDVIKAKDMIETKSGKLVIDSIKFTKRIDAGNYYKEPLRKDKFLVMKGTFVNETDSDLYLDELMSLNVDWKGSVYTSNLDIIRNRDFSSDTKVSPKDKVSFYMFVSISDEFSEEKIESARFFLENEAYKIELN